MPHSEAGGVKIANWAPSGTTEKEHFSQHHFVGGNVFMLNVLQNNVGELGITASTEAIEATKQRTIKQLRTETASVRIVGLKRRGNRLVATVRVENKTGHKFPTGIPIRAAWLHLKVTDAAGTTVFESGRLQDDGLIVGNKNDQEPRDYERHHRVISDPDDVQVYETVMIDTDDRVTYTLLRAARYIKDNRLLPKGFDKATAVEDIAVYGQANTDEDFSGGSDLVTYEVNTAGYQGPFTVWAELLYRSVTPAFVADMEIDSGLPEVRRFLKYYNKADKQPVAVAAAEAVSR